jgi:ADP-ribose pyrophosphatase YjhB (NUDIX family)
MSSTASILPVPAVNAAILSRDRKILLTRRSPSVREPGKWCLPGGHLEFGECWVPAMRREVAEETGLVVRSETLIGIYSDPQLTVAQPAGGAPRRQFVVTLFLVTDFEGDVKPNDEVDLWDWFPAGKLPSPILKSHPIRVEDAFNFQQKVFVR